MFHLYNHGSIVYGPASYQDCLDHLAIIQPQPVDWAMRYEGWSIRKAY